MPSLVTPRAADGSMSGSSKSFSRVNSFKRDWGNEEVENPPKSSLKGSSTHSIEWSASPEQRQKPKTETRAASPAPVVHPMNETAADRRRKAILAALQPNADGFTSSFSSASSSTVGSRAVPSSSFYPPRKALVTLDDDEPSSGQRASATEELPSIPSRSAGVSSAGESKKRAFPWNEDILVAKKAMQNNSSTSKRSGSTGSSGLAAAPTMNIKQKIVLSTEQQQVLQLVVAEGKNMFFTGSAGAYLSLDGAPAETLQERESLSFCERSLPL
ncbi:hypothetical protein BD324DRAFT_29926 [Kockovaella imperatae]|uniref:Uncharacterized protein n=1 Tax=Kockovaella imperatae TaxID=4999 RepID=A0A1Y1UUT0_9TREE|nr:hypothetical protein BD324DRAFT_29926 [Kockovaella imperatae]ORX40955.1 hypothetical protein BD324DRAFT_29926 [Kockovaella imperatae]